jgi:hypothetical protein
VFSFENVPDTEMVFSASKLLRDTLYIWSWDSSVSIATGYGLEDGGVGSLSPSGARIFTSPSYPTSADVKKMWFYTSTPLYAFMA